MEPNVFLTHGCDHGLPNDAKQLMAQMKCLMSHQCLSVVSCQAHKVSVLIGIYLLILEAPIALANTIYLAHALKLLLMSLNWWHKEHPSCF